MNTKQLFKRCKRCIVINKISVNPLSNQVVIDGGKSLRAFWVMSPHVVQLTIAMGNEGSGRHLFSLCDPAPRVAHVEGPLSSQLRSCFKHAIGA